MRRFLPAKTLWLPGAPFLFVLAGLSVIVAIFCGSVLWGDCIEVGLAMILVAIISGTNGLRRPAAALPATGVDWKKPSRTLILVLASAVAIHLIAAGLTIHFIPGHIIDCFTFQRDAAWKFLHGTNPYGTTEPNYYTNEASLQFYGRYVLAPGKVLEGMPYTPITLFWTLPGALLGDLRLSYIAAIVISALLLFLIKPGVRSAILASFLLLDPMTCFIESRSWTEPLTLMLLTATMYAALRGRRWLPIALGLFLVGKQFNFLALPFIFLLAPEATLRSRARLFAESLAVGALTFLPVAPRHMHALWHDLVIFHTLMPYRTDALTFSVLFPAMIRVGPFLVLGIVLWLLAAGMPSKNKGLFAPAYAVTLLVFVVTNKQGFDNYYFLTAHALLLGAVCLPEEPFWTARAAVEAGGTSA